MRAAFRRRHIAERGRRRLCEAGPASRDGRCPNCPKSKPSAAASSPPWWARASWRSSSAARTCASRSRSASPSACSGETVTALGRRAKYLLADLSSGEVLVMHLGMSGRFLVGRDGTAPRCRARSTTEHGGESAHDHVVFHLSNGATVTYNDARRFGFMDLVPRARDRDLPAFRRDGHRAARQRALGRRHRAPLRGPAHAAEGGAPRPAPDRRPRQHLCVRGAVPRGPASGGPGGLPRHRGRAAARRRRGASPTSSATF